MGVTGVYTNYLTDARESLYLTLDRLKNEPSTHPLNATLGDVMEVTSVLSIYTFFVKFTKLVNSHADFLKKYF